MCDFSDFIEEHGVTAEVTCTDKGSHNTPSHWMVEVKAGPGRVAGFKYNMGAAHRHWTDHATRFDNRAGDGTFKGNRVKPGDRVPFIMNGGLTINDDSMIRNGTAPDEPTNTSTWRG